MIRPITQNGRLIEVPLGQVGVFRAGYGFPVGLQGRREGRYPFAKVGDISRVARSGVREIARADHYVEEEDLLVLKAHPLPANSIVFAKIGEAISQNYRAITTCEMLVDNNTMGFVANQSRLDTRYALHFFLRLDLYRYTGATTVPAIRKSTLESIPIPLPYPDDPKRSLAEQRRIAAILDKADAIRRRCHKAQGLLEHYVPSLFHEMFGDPYTNAKNWPLVEVNEFVDQLQGGKNIATDDRPNDRTKHFILKVSAVTWGDYRPAESKPVPISFEPPDAYFVHQGDLLISRANTRELIGAAVYVDETPSNVILPDKIWRFVWRRPRRVEPLFIHALFRHPVVQNEIGRRASGTSGSMKNIAKPKLLSMRVPLPPLALQKEFSTSIAYQWRIWRTLRQRRDGYEDLFKSLAQRAFRGEL